MNNRINNILIAIPAYNTAACLRKIIECLPLENLLVVNDGSTDETASLLIEMAVTHLTHDKNLGLSEAIRSAEKYCEDHGYEGILFLDSDGQHPPEMYHLFLAQLESCGFVIGDRFSNLENIPSQKVHSNVLASLLIADVTGVFLRDVSCGYRGYRISTQNKSDTALLEGYADIFYRLIDHLRTGTIISRVPIPAIYDISLPLATKSSELLGLCDAVLAVEPHNKYACTISECVKERKEFELCIGGLSFSTKYISSINQYVIKTDHLAAIKLYG